MDAPVDEEKINGQSPQVRSLIDHAFHADYERGLSAGERDLPASEDRETTILDAFVELADSLVADYDPLDFLYGLLDHSLPLTGSVAGGVLLHYDGRLHLVATSSHLAEHVSLLEFQNGDGPAHEAFKTGATVRVEKIADASDRWPEFVEASVAYGWTSAFAVPLRLRDYVAGAFVVFWSGDQAHPNGDDAKLLRGFADVATIAVLQRRALADVEKINDQLHVALESRIQIEQAKGMVANANGVAVGVAFDQIRRHSRSTSQRLSTVAAAIVAGDLETTILANS